MTGIKAIRRHVYMWPPMEQVDIIGSKRCLLANLDHVSRVLKTVRPVSKALEPGCLIPSGVVLKRTHSENSQHIILPNEEGRDWDSLGTQMEVPGCIWIAQSFIPELDAIGEWRVFLIGGRIVYCVHTKYNSERRIWKYEPVTEYYSLDELTYVCSLNSSLYF